MRIQELFRFVVMGISMVWLVAIVSGCASREGSADAAAPVSAASVGPPVSSISKVTVKLDADLEEDRVERFNEESGNKVLQEVVEDKLSSAGRLSHQGGPTMELLVTEFRLRSTGAAFWVGPMAGNDNIKVTVTILDGGRQIKSFESYSSTILGGMIMPAADVRLRRVCNAVADDILAKL